MAALRKLIFDKLEPDERTDRLSRITDWFLILLITVNVVAVIFETVNSIEMRYRELFHAIELFSVSIFTLEYLARVWACVEHESLSGERYPRLKNILSPMALIDLVAILPFFLGAIMQNDLRVLRVLRLLRIFKLTRYSAAMTMLLDVFRKEANSFFAGFFILILLLVLASSGAYLAEYEVQPEAFGSIPAAMWWAVATLTTVGYGDVTPITPVGEIFGALVAVVGIGMAALPAGILASGMADQLRRTRDALTDRFRTALEDGIIDAEEERDLEDLRYRLGLSRAVAEEIRREVLRKREDQQRMVCAHCGKPVIFDTGEI